MSHYNPYISNGTCYLAPHRAAASQMLPCGNAALGHKACCQAGDMCLSSNACYNQPFGTTYLAGCSDPDFADGSCPDKGAFAEQHWAGLVYCNGTSREWVACAENAEYDILTKPDFCFCPETSRTVAFTDNSILTNIVSLPTAAGGSVRWEPDFLPTDAPTDAPTVAGQQSSTDYPRPTEAPAVISDEPTSGLSRGAKIGLGVGVGVGASLIFAILLALFLFHRRRKLSTSCENELKTSSELPNNMMTPDTPTTLAPSELDIRAARPWSMRSELQTPDTPRSLADHMEGKYPSAAVSSATRPDNRQQRSGSIPLGTVAELPG